MSGLYILGNGGFAHELFDQLVLQTQLPDYIFKGFITVKGNKAFCVSEEGVKPFTYPKFSSFVLGTNKTDKRDLLIKHFSKYYSIDVETFPNVISSSAYVSKLANLGYGNIVSAGSIIAGEVSLGNFNSLNIKASINNNTEIGSNNIIGPGVTILTKSKIGDFNFIGANAVIGNRLTIGSHNTVSAGEFVESSMNNREFFQSGYSQNKPEMHETSKL